MDRLVTPHVETTSWTRFLDLLDSAILQVDEASYQRRAAEAAGQRDVRSYRGEHGLRTLVAKAEAGDVAAFEALVARVAQCLADDGDEEDPVGVRRSKAVGIIAHQARLRDLLARHADQPDDPRHPDQRVAAHQAYPTDPDGWDEELPVDPADQAWHHQQQQDQQQGQQTAPGPHPADDTHPADVTEPSGAPVSGSAGDTPARTPIPAAFARAAAHAGDSAGRLGHCTGCGCGTTFDLRPMNQSELNACRSRVVVHVHVSDHTLIDQHGVLRTADGPITLDQFRRWLTDTDPNITIRPVLDPAHTAAIDNYEIPASLRDAVHTRHPGSVWPYSPATQISGGGRLDLDHTRPYLAGGPPGQTRLGNLGPLTRAEHRAKTHTGWQARQPDPGTHLWRSPHGLTAIVTNQGTLLLGDSPFTQAVWQAAQPEAAAG